MPNQNLKAALDRAGLTADEFADIIRVDPRTVERWVAGRTPYRRHRATIARALDVTEQELWPGADAGGAEDGEAIGGSQTGPLQLAGVWSSVDDPDVPDLAVVIADASGPVDVIDSSPWIGVDDQLASALGEHAGLERPVRIISCEPTRVLLSLIGHPHIEIRITDGWNGCWLLRAGEMILSSLSAVLDVDSPPLMMVEQRRADGLFTRLANDFEDLWRQHDNVLTDADQLADWVEDEPDDGQAGVDEPPPATPVRPPSSEPGVDSGSASSSAGERRRRWPGRSG